MAADLVSDRVMVLHLATQHDAAGLEAAVGVVWEASGSLLCRHAQLVQHQEGVEVPELARPKRPADAHACACD